MATSTSMFSHNERRSSSDSDEQSASASKRVVKSQNNGGPPRPGQHLDGSNFVVLISDEIFKEKIVRFRC